MRPDQPVFRALERPRRPTTSEHIVDGRLHELEIFDVDAGEGTPVDPTSVTSLDPPQVD
jgi:hypothetical protein